MPAAITIPERLDRTVRARQGEPGAAWLAALPSVIAEYLDHWKLTAERVFEPGGRTSLVVAVRRADGTPAALKIGLATAETAREGAALARWDGRGAVRLLDTDPAPTAEQASVLLLERLHGDISLRSLAEAKAMLEAAGLLQRLWVPPHPEHPFHTVADHVAGLGGILRDALGGTPRSAPPLPGTPDDHRDAPAPSTASTADLAPLVGEALETSATLLASGTEGFLLHGDFHHGNVLAADRVPWLATAPEPLVGERAYDLARLAHDRMDTLLGSPGPEAAVRRRIHRLADSLEVDRERLRGWTLFRTVTAGVLSLADGDTAAAELYLEFADRL